MNLSSAFESKQLELNVWFIRLRWIASGVALLLVIVTIKGLHYLNERTFWPLIIIILLLAFTNVLFTVMVKKGIFLIHLREIQIISDLLILTLMLHFSGGIENPLSFVYIFHVILSGILLPKRKCFMVVAFAFLMYMTMALSELSGVIPHYTLDIFPHSDTEHQHEAEVDHASPGQNSHRENAVPGEPAIHASHYPPFVWSMSALSFFIMILTAYFITNIMDRLRTEEIRTREERQRLEHVLQATGAGLLILNKELKAVWYNDPVKKWLNITPDNSHHEQTVISEWIEGWEGPAAETLKNGKIRSIERERIDDSGQKQFFQITVAPLSNNEGGVYQVVELIQDVTQKKILEAEMLHAAKMVTLGTMSAGIAHEVGNPLASISTRLHLLEREHDEAFIIQSVRLLRNEISRIERIVRGISQFGRPAKEGWKPCQVNKIIGETVEMLKYHKAAKRCSFSLDLSPGLPETLGVSDQLKQVFLNLGLNALEAMPDGGKLTIRTYMTKGNLSVEFIDKGTGIDDEVREAIFNPFYTTKEKGSGLGLFIVSHIVQAHGGKLQVESSKGKGSKFVVIIPVHWPFHIQKSNNKMS